MNERAEEGQRWLAIRLAGLRGDTAFLRAAITDPVWRPTVADALGKLGCREAIPEIARLLDASDPAARIAALRALGSLQAGELVPRITEVAEHDPEDNVRSWALGALGKLGDPASLPVLLRQLQSPVSTVREGAAVGLGRLGRKEALPALEAARQENRWRSRNYRTAIRLIKGKGF